MDISGNFILIEFGKIPRLVKSSRFLRHGVDISGNLKLMDFSGFLRFQLRVRIVRYRIFLFTIRGSK